MRKKVLINPQFQMKLINYVVIFYTFISIIYFGINYFLIKKMISFGVEAKLSPTSSYFHFVKNLEAFTFIWYGLAFFLGLIFVYLIGLYISLRIAGPIYRIDKTLNEYMQETRPKDEQVVNIKLRENDFFMDHAHLVSNVLNKLKKSQD